MAKVFYTKASITTPANPTDVFVLTGSENAIVRLRKLVFSSISNPAGPVEAILTKRSADNTGGTRAALTAVPGDAISSALASAFTYTANAAALGASLGGIFYVRYQTGLSSSGVTTHQTPLMLTDDPIVVLPNEILAISLATLAPPAGHVMYLSAAWDEA